MGSRVPRVDFLLRPTRTGSLRDAERREHRFFRNAPFTPPWRVHARFPKSNPAGIVFQMATELTQVSSRTPLEESGHERH